VKRHWLTKLSFLILAGAFLFFQFKLSTKKPPGDQPKTLPEHRTYDSAKAFVSFHRLKLKTAFEKRLITPDSLATAYTNLLLNQIIPHWYGTFWDFNGITAQPRTGNIACGYFVSTTLLHSGMKLNRYKMAQKAAMEEAELLEPHDSLFIWYGHREGFLASISKKAKDGLYLIGLSFHVGYLYKSGSEIHFIHSNYIEREGVIKEDAYNSEALHASSVFVLADITNNPTLMRKWLDGVEIR